jgi:hypothetical protein
LFDLDNETKYTAREGDPVGTFTARIDLADYLLRQACDSSAVRRTMVVSTTEHTPSFLTMVRREAFGGTS